MSKKVYIYGLCDVFYDGFYIQGIKENYKNHEFNISKFPNLKQGTFAFIVEDDNYSKKIIIDSKDSPNINIEHLRWCDIYGKINYNADYLPVEKSNKIIAIGPSFGIKIWNLFETGYHLFLNFAKFRKSISHQREFIANYWRQYKRLSLKDYTSSKSSINKVFFINSLWKKENQTNTNRALFIEACKSIEAIDFEGGFAARRNNDILGYDDLIYSKVIPLNVYIEKIKESAFVFNTPAVLSCHGWKLGEFLALGKAIITTPHYNKLPADLLNNEYAIYAEDSQSIKNAIEELIKNTALKNKLELNSRTYFEEHLAPKKVIKKLTQN